MSRLWGKRVRYACWFWWVETKLSIIWQILSVRPDRHAVTILTLTDHVRTSCYMAHIRAQNTFWLQGLFWTNSTKSSALVYILPLPNIFQRVYFVKFGGESRLALLFFEPWPTYACQANSFSSGYITVQGIVTFWLYMICLNQGFSTIFHRGPKEVQNICLRAKWTPLSELFLYIFMYSRDDKRAKLNWLLCGSRARLGLQAAYLEPLAKLLYPS